MSGGYRFWSLDVRVPSNSTAIRIWDPAHHHDFCNVNLQSLTPQGTCGGTNDMGVYATDPSPGPLSLRGGTRFAYFSFHGFLGAAAETLVDNTLWEDNGDVACYHANGACDAGPESHTWYIHPNVLVAGTNSQVWTNNEVVVHRCGGNMVGITGAVNGGRFENNYIHNEGPDQCGFCGALSSGPTGNATDVSNIVIRRNRLKATWASLLSCIQNSQFTDNILIPAPGNVGLSVGTEDGNSGGCGNGTTAIKVVNNTIYNGSVTFASVGTNHILRNNAAYTSGGGCFRYGGNVSADHNYCASSNPSAVWVAPSTDLSTGNFRPANPGPLIGTANQTHYSPTAIGTVTWDPTDSVSRSPPIDIGAMVSSAAPPPVSVAVSPNPAPVQTNGPISAPTPPAAPAIATSAASEYANNQTNADVIVTVPANSWVITFVHYQAAAGTPSVTLDPAGTPHAAAEIGHMAGPVPPWPPWGTWVFRYWTSSSLGDVTVRASAGGATWDGAQTTYVVTGSDATGIEATASASGNTNGAAMQTRITTQADFSLVLWGLSYVPGSGAAPTPALNNSLLHGYYRSGGDSAASGQHNGNLPAGTLTVGSSTLYANQPPWGWNRWNLYAVEIKAVGGAHRPYR